MSTSLAPPLYIRRENWNFGVWGSISEPHQHLNGSGLVLQLRLRPTLAERCRSFLYLAPAARPVTLLVVWTTLLCESVDSARLPPLCYLRLVFSWFLYHGHAMMFMNG
jgi:hypothetical protein